MMSGNFWGCWGAWPTGAGADMGCCPSAMIMECEAEDAPQAEKELGEGQKLPRLLLPD